MTKGGIKMSVNSLVIKFCLILFVIHCFGTPLLAQPSRDRILGDLLIDEQSEQVEVQIEFNFPVRYIRHFPETEGAELRIQLKPIAVGQADRDAIFKREAISADQYNAADITEVVYEGDNIGSLLLTVYFSKARTFSVEQGNDYRSIQLVVKKSDSYPPAE